MLNPNIHVSLAHAHLDALRRSAEAAHRAAALPRRKPFTRFGIGRLPRICRVSPALRGSTSAST